MDTSQFLQHLAERLGAHPEVAQQALGDLVDHLHAQLGAGEPVELPGLGRLVPHGGALQFTPEDELLRLANHDFAGLSSLVFDEAGTINALAPPPPDLAGDSHPSAPPEPPTVSDEPAALPEPEAPEAAVAEPASVETETPSGEAEAETPSEEEARDAPFIGEWPDDAFEEGAADDAETEVPADAPSEPALSEPDADAARQPPSTAEEAASPALVSASEAPAEPATTPPAPGRPAARRSPLADVTDDEATSRTGLWLGLSAILVLVLAGALYLLFRPGDEPAPTEPVTAEQRGVISNEAEQTETPIADDNPVQTTPDGAEVPSAEDPETIGDEPSVVAEEAEAPDEAVGEEIVDSGDPLYSEGPIRTALGGYAVVVGSTPRLALAEELAGRFRSLGFRTGILTDNTGEITRHRVVVGQFETVNEAASILDDENRPADLPEDAWVLAIE